MAGSVAAATVVVAVFAAAAPVLSCHVFVCMLVLLPAFLPVFLAVHLPLYFHVCTGYAPGSHRAFLCVCSVRARACVCVSVRVRVRGHPGYAAWGVGREAGSRAGEHPAQPPQ